MNKEIYYIKFFKKDEKEGICKICGKNTCFKSVGSGYFETCSSRCATLNLFSSEEYREKQKRNNYNGIKANKIRSEKAIERMNTKEYKNSGVYQKMGLSMKEKWANDRVYREKVVKSMHEKFLDKEFNERFSLSMRKLWLNEEYVKKMQSRNNSYKTGYFFSVKNNETLFYQSSYELKAFEILEKDNDVLSFKKANIFIQYLNDANEKRSYVPDFIATYKNGSKIILEIKPKRLRPENFLKFEAGFKYCKEKGFKYEIWDEDILFKKLEFAKREFNQ
jgi:hypothetical protein